MGGYVYQCPYPHDGHLQLELEVIPQEVVAMLGGPVQGPPNMGIDYLTSSVKALWTTRGYHGGITSD